MGDITRYRLIPAMKARADGEFVSHADHAEAIREKDAEIARYRQAIWDARAIMGFDNDGDPTPVALTFPHMADMLVREATEFRADYDEANRECERAEDQRDACVAALKKCLAQLEILVPDRGMVHDELMAILDARAAIASAEKGEG